MQRKAKELNTNLRRASGEPQLTFLLKGDQKQFITRVTFHTAITISIMIILAF